MTAPTFPNCVANTLTAFPLLRLLLAMKGEDPESPSQMVAWEVYQDFLRHPAQGEEDASFQTEWMEIDQSVLQIRFSRQLTDDAAGYGALTQAVVIEYGFAVEKGPADGSTEIWLSESRGLKDFLARIEAHPAFTFCQENGTMDRMVYQAEAEKE